MIPMFSFDDYTRLVKKYSHVTHEYEYFCHYNHFGIIRGMDHQDAEDRIYKVNAELEAKND